MKLSTTVTAVALLTAATAQAGEIAPGDVQFDEYGAVTTSLTGQPGDPANGRAVLISKSRGNCIACHGATDYAEEPFHGEVGPTLDGVADRWGEAELRGILINAKMTYDGTIMPAFYKTEGFVRPGDAYTGKAAPADLPPILTAQEIEDVVAYLMTLKEES